MSGSYDSSLVSLSVFIAIAASYTAFSLSARITDTRGKASILWLAGGAFSMGLGIWAMHFIGMLAFRLPVPVSYRIAPTLFSLLIAIVVSGFALGIASRSKLDLPTLIVAGAVMGIGIASMHYTGMFAMNMGMMLHFDPVLFGASIGIAVIASIIALRIVFVLGRGEALHRQKKKLVGSVVMGAAIAGMHYTGMSAARFTSGVTGIAGSSLNQYWFGVAIGFAVFMILLITIILSLVDSHLSSRTAMLVQSLRNANEQLHYLALHDGLTKLPNRTFLEDRIDQAIRHATMQSGSFPVIFLDLDRFKPINDYMGHQAGDKILQTIGTRLTEYLSPDDTVARLGGDEFVIVLSSVKDFQSIHEVAQRILEAISIPVTIDGQPVTISGSIGISLYPHDAKTFRSLLVTADNAMYHAKKKGPGNIQFFSEEINTSANQRTEMEYELRQAILHHEFELHYQPKVTIKTGYIESLEALLRWNHPARGLLFPKDFIPLAEETGLIVPLGTWVIQEACRENAGWQKAGLPRLRVAVNLSACQFLRQDLPTIITEALEEAGLAPDCLEIEITETLLMHDPESAEKTLSEIRSKGVHVAIDDFGTGYSSLAYLKKFSLDKLKIDRSFVMGIDVNEDDAAIVRTIITLAHSLNLRVIAEGVETAGQMAILKDLGCDAYQGYYKTVPLPAHQMVRLMKAEREEKKEARETE